MSDEILKVVIICVTVIVLFVVVLVGYIISIRITHEVNRDFKIMQQGLQRMQEQCNDMYARYEELTDKINRGR